MVVHDEFSRRVGIGCLGSIEGEMDREKTAKIDNHPRCNLPIFILVGR